MPNGSNLKEQVFFRLMVSGNMVHCSGKGMVGDYLEWQEPAASTSHILADHEAESKLEVGSGINPQGSLLVAYVCQLGFMSQHFTTSQNIVTGWASSVLICEFSGNTSDSKQRSGDEKNQSGEIPLHLKHPAPLPLKTGGCY